MVESLRKPFVDELEEVRVELIRMAGLVIEAIPRCTEALLASDLAAAQEIIDGDNILDDASLALEHHCQQLLALQQPMAGDLRTILAAMTINHELERSGDLVENIAKAMRRVYGIDFGPRLRGLITQMSEEATRLMRFAVDAFADGNSGLAAALDDIDDRLDRLNHQCLALIVGEEGREMGDLMSGVQLALIARYYERIGDHAVNIGERVRYMVDGWRPGQSEELPADQEPDLGTEAPAG
ncbi:MAG: phosphate signaling complex protein PhoU [bacterium]|nr:phosphate signaling complex protein PhoU [bacterium]MXV90809.1 phosphate signaling complex protein PhoU [Acidimicrobiia bacterium]MYC44779.1 phosphate signaling complex protein PhoU [Acidimicrobiia bacterium]MYI19112.1 phosphate signaling complex protein PhoU [Acidimicrobiia bacterium]